jgi:hypothetical protein
VECLRQSSLLIAIDFAPISMLILGNAEEILVERLVRA